MAQTDQDEPIVNVGTKFTVENFSSFFPCSFLPVHHGDNNEYVVELLVVESFNDSMK